MKEIIAIVRQNKMNITKRALADTGFYSMTSMKVMGHGKGKVDYMLLAGAEQGHEEAISQLGSSLKLVPKRLISIVVPDNLVKNIVDSIIEVNRSENHGDGKIFVLPVTDAVRVRTGETGEKAIDTLI
jgi:nitrogen regulatory protein PII 2